MKNNNNDTSLDLSQEIQTKLGLLNQQRLRANKKAMITWIIAIASTLIIFFLRAGLSLQGNQAWFVTLILCLIPLGIAKSMVYSSKKVISNHFKRNIIDTVLTDKYPDLSYQQDQYIGEQDFTQSAIFLGQTSDRFSGEDLFHGIHGKTAYRFSEIHAQEKHETTDSDGNTSTSYSTIFQGIFMVADFNKHINSITRVIQAKDHFLSKFFNKKTRVQLENPEFEALFNTFSDDQTEARYILTPTLMEKILALQKVFNTKVHLSFYQNHIYIAINSTYNYFEPNIKKELNTHQIERILKEIQLCLEIIDILDLNTRIWTKD